jgi:ASC-1-like (ASCH) protein
MRQVASQSSIDRRKWFTTVLELATDGRSEWCEKLRNFDDGKNALHMAILTEPYLQYVLEGRKTIETRFSVNRMPPYNQVSEGDIILLKKSSGPIVGICEVSKAWFYRLDERSWKEIQEKFFTEISVQDSKFWRDKKKAVYASLMRLKDATRIGPINYVKHDQRPWVILVPRLATASMDQFSSG